MKFPIYTTSVRNKMEASKVSTEIAKVSAKSLRDAGLTRTETDGINSDECLLSLDSLFILASQLRCDINEILQTPVTDLEHIPLAREPSSVTNLGPDDRDWTLRSNTADIRTVLLGPSCPKKLKYDYSKVPYEEDAQLSRRQKEEKRAFYDLPPGLGFDTAKNKWVNDIWISLVEPNTLFEGKEDLESFESALREIKSLGNLESQVASSLEALLSQAEDVNRLASIELQTKFDHFQIFTLTTSRTLQITEERLEWPSQMPADQFNRDWNGEYKFSYQPELIETIFIVAPLGYECIRLQFYGSKTELHRFDGIERGPMYSGDLWGAIFSDDPIPF